METVFDALKAMGKATSIELAARLDISREEVLNELWELKKAGCVDKSAYTWRVADNNVQQEQPAQVELPEETTTATVAKISECDLTATIEQRGPQTADELEIKSKRINELIKGGENAKYVTEIFRLEKERMTLAAENAR
ncbi:hypothetical protein MXE97_27525, partial [Escherichia coli]|nr:hypothetical protein [Escherichia coli]